MRECYVFHGLDLNTTTRSILKIINLLGSLTKREQEVFTLLKKGQTNSEIASALYISESTVKSHLRSIFRKLGVNKRNEAQLLALQGVNTAGTKAVTG
ncbi:MAG TPA: response regulator transcription factor [Syntrophomonadaceae bacterium]|nr:response regulator transcription factor [Syntrophomonadaceae bacterium]